MEMLGAPRIVGSDFSLPSATLEGVIYAVNVSITGTKKLLLPTGNYKMRCKIEFVRDGEPSVFSGGWIYK